MRSRKILLALTLVALGAAAPPSIKQSAPIFRFETDEFWLNLHHFLYVLGRAENRTPDRNRDAVVRAPADADSGLARLSEEERQAWRRAVAFYAADLSKKDAVFDSLLPAIGHALAGADDAPSLAKVAIDTGLARALGLAAPVYRKAWWPAHQRANVTARKAYERLVRQHGDTMLKFITAAYSMSWPADGYPVHLSGYTNWSGAYSTAGNLLVVSSLARDLEGTQGIETLFHEGMHQWDSAVFQLLRTHARAMNGLVPNGLSHAMIFFTAGEAARRIIPGHTPFADAAGVWNRGMAQFREPLIAAWKPYLDGKGTRDDALKELVRLTLVRRPP